MCVCVQTSTYAYMIGNTLRVYVCLWYHLSVLACSSLWFMHWSYICVYAHLYMSMRVCRSKLMSVRVCTFMCLVTCLYCCTLQKETIFFSLASASLRSQPTNGEDLRMADIFVPKRSRFLRIPSRLGIHYLFLVSLIFFFTTYSLLILEFFCLLGIFSLLLFFGL